jgi:hypothetical protein
MKQKEIRVLMVEPGKHPVETVLQNDLELLQKAVSVGSTHQGLIEIIGIYDRVCVLCNEEGKLIGLEGNRRLGNDLIAGVFYIVGEGGQGNLSSLSEVMSKYSKQFWELEYFTEDAAIVMYLL